MGNVIVRNVPVFGVDLTSCRADATPDPIDHSALQRIVDNWNRREAETGHSPRLVSCSPSRTDQECKTLGHVERPRIVGDVLIADVVWLDGHADQIPIRRWMTPELWSDHKSGQKWIDPVVAHATREEIRTGCSWIQNSP